jgi:hypothetical protein
MEGSQSGALNENQHVVALVFGIHLMIIYRWCRNNVQHVRDFSE